MVSRICVGCMSYGNPTEDLHLWTLPQPETQEMVKCAIDRGINFYRDCPKLALETWCGCSNSSYNKG